MTSRTQVLFFRLGCEARRVLVCVGLGLCFAAYLAPVPGARAQAVSANSDAYKQLIEQALSEFRHKNWPEARVLFRRAHELSPSARTLRGMGVVSYEMRDYVQAVRDLDAALSDSRQPLNQEQRSEAETLLSRARTFVGVYNVSVDPGDAVLLLDRNPAEREADGTLLLSFGEHVISASREGYENARAQITVQGGERGEVKLALVPVSEAPVAAPLVDAAPELTPPPSASRDMDTTEAPQRKLRYTWVALGASAVFGGASAAFWFLGDSKLDKLAKRCDEDAQRGSPCVKGKVSTDAIERYELLTNVSLGLTGASLIATGVLAYIEWPRSRERPVALGVGPTSLSVRGAF